MGIECTDCHPEAQEAGDRHNQLMRTLGEGIDRAGGCKERRALGAVRNQPAGDIAGHERHPAARGPYQP